MSEAKFNELIADLAVVQSNMSMLDEDRPRVLRAIVGLKVAEEMYRLLELAMSLMDGDSIEDFTYQYQELNALLAKARGEA